MQAEAFQPKIVAFCCHYCAYSSADLAGSMRIQYPPNVRIIALPHGAVETESHEGLGIWRGRRAGCRLPRRRLPFCRRQSLRQTPGQLYPGLLLEIGLEKDRIRMVNIYGHGSAPGGYD